MHRRKYLASLSIATSLGLAGCSGETGTNNSSGGSGGTSGGGGSGGGSEETATPSGGGEATEAEDGGGSTESDDATESGDEADTDTESEGETDSGGNDTEEDTETSGSSGDSGGSSSIEDSGDTDVSLQSADVADAYSLDSVAFYSEEFSSGVRGEVTNTSDSTISYTEIQVRFYDSEDTRLGEGLDNTSDLGAGETYAFDVPSLLTSDEVDSIASYTVTVTDSAL